MAASLRAKLGGVAEHYPYKLDTVLAIVAEDGPCGPEGASDDRVRATDLMNEEIARASAAYIEAQANFKLKPSDVTRTAYQTTRDALVLARKAHRANRKGSGPNVTAVRGVK